MRSSLSWKAFRAGRAGALLALMAVALLALAACRPAKAEVKIGILFDYTGSLAEIGIAMRTGAELAARHINDAGGVLDGRKVKLVHRDSQTSPGPGVDGARALVDIEKVPAIVGSLASGVTIPVAESVTIPNKVVLISPASTSVAITALKDDDFVFRTVPSDLLQGGVLGKLARDQGFRTAATMFINNAYGQGLTAKFKEVFERLGGKVTAAVPHEDAQPTYVSELRRAMADKPDVLVAISYPGQANVYLKEAIGAGLARKFLFVDGTKSVEMIKAVGADNLNGMFGTAAGAAESDAGKVFKDEYKKVYKELPPLPYIDTSYDALVLIALAIEKAGKADGPSIKAALRDVANPPGEKVGPGLEGIKRALRLIREGKDIDYEGPGGSQNFDAAGDVITTIEVWTIERGEIKTVRYETPEVR